MRSRHLITWCILILIQADVANASNFRQKAEALKDQTLGLHHKAESSQERTWEFHHQAETLKERTLGIHHHAEPSKAETLKEQSLALYHKAATAKEQAETSTEQTSGVHHKAETSKKNPVSEEVREIMDSMAEVDIPGTFKKDHNRFHSTFLSGLKFGAFSVIITLSFLFVAVVWFTLFFKYFYHSDREEADGSAEPEHSSRSSVVSQTITGLEDVREIDRQNRTDVMFVFHHPDHPYSDNSATVPTSHFEEVLVYDGLPPDKRHEQMTHQYFHRTTQMKWTSQQKPWWSRFTGRENYSDTPDCDDVTLEDARIGFLQDLYQDMLGMGFSVDVFSSCDEDEIFLSVNISKSEVFEHYLHSEKIMLEINKTLIGKLGIGQPSNVPAPSLLYDPKIVQGLHRAKVIDELDWVQVFKQNLHIKGDEVKVKMMSDRERIRAIYQMLSKFVNLFAAIDKGFLVDWYPVHSPYQLHKIKAAWGRWELLLDMSFKQPVNTLNSYFGSRVTFMYAWIGFYCKAMLALLPLALIAAVAAYILQYSGLHGIKVIVLGFNIIIVLWSRLAYNLWEREESYLKEMWGLSHGIDGQQHLVRPTFHGEYVPSKEDSNKWEIHYSPNLLGLRKAVSAFVTAFFCIVCGILIYIWYAIFEGRLTFLSGTLLVAQVKVLEVVFNYVTKVLIEFENHKYAHSYYESYIWKYFTFHAVNQYAAYFYIAFKLQYSPEGCPNGSCLEMLQHMLLNVQISLSAVSIGIFLATSHWVRFKLWYELYQYKKAHDGREPPERPRSEQEAKMSRFGVDESITFLCPLVLSAGFIILFGGIVPIMVPLILILFAIKLRIGAHVLLNYSKRPFPRKQMGIGSWKDIMLLLMRFGIFFSGVLLINYSDAFVGTPLVTKVSGLIVYCALMLIMSALVDLCVPATNEDVKTLRAQHAYVLHTINQKCKESHDGDDDDFQQAVRENKQIFWESPIATSEWSEIRPLAVQSASRANL